MLRKTVFFSQYSALEEQDTEELGAYIYLNTRLRRISRTIKYVEVTLPSANRSTLKNQQKHVLLLQLPQQRQKQLQKPTSGTKAQNLYLFYLKFIFSFAVKFCFFNQNITPDNFVVNYHRNK